MDKIQKIEGAWYIVDPLTGIAQSKAFSSKEEAMKSKALASFYKAKNKEQKPNK